MDSPILNVTTRTITGKQVKQLRKQGQLPGVVYGHELKSQSLVMAEKDYDKVFRSAGTSTLVDLVIDKNKPVKVLLHEPQLHPSKSTTLHADFYAVKMNEKLQTEIPLHFVGEAEAVSVLDGTLTTPLDAVQVECFPDKLVPAIEVDITLLKTFEDIIRISDIKTPEGIEILDDPETVVATVTEPRSEEELAELDEAVESDEDTMAKVEVEEKGEEDGEEAAETEA